MRRRDFIKAMGGVVARLRARGWFAVGAVEAQVQLATVVPASAQDTSNLRVEIAATAHFGSIYSVAFSGDGARILDVVTVERLRYDEPSKPQFNVFFGHGRDRQWRDLKDHLQDQHNIRVVAYEVGPRAGYAVKEVLQKMLSQSSFAVLVLTGEDIHKDGGLHARENVVHELGLLQGRFGFSRAIALVEEGVREFTNIYGVSQIRFSKGNIRETFGDILATIRREFKQFR